MESPDFIFLNESLLFKFEEPDVTELFRGEYNQILNSDDVHDPELPFVKSKSNGGTMILWKKTLNQFVTTLPSETPSFQGLLFHPPHCPQSLHVSLYFPTSGKETEFIEEITKLRDFIEDVLKQHPGTLIFIRGDSNVNRNNAARLNIFNNFKSTFNLTDVPITHKTYHHFLGDGLFDSAIDVILYSEAKDIKEEVKNIYCKHDYPSINSHHDLIVSAFALPTTPAAITPPSSFVPSIPNKRIKIKWSTEDIPTYQKLIGRNLANLRARWSDPTSKACTSMLIQSTSDILSSAASSSNQSISLSEKPSPTSSRTPKAVKNAVNVARRRLAHLKRISPTDPDMQVAKAKAREAKMNLRKVIRMCNGTRIALEVKKMFAILSSDDSSSTIYRKIKSLKTSRISQIPFLIVGPDIYHGEDVKRGFFTSISQLKTRPSSSIPVETTIDYAKDYEYILDICKNKRDLPSVSIITSTEILKAMKPTVNDFYSITPAHYLNAGEAGLKHFNYLMNTIIEDVNKATIEELNACYALLLFKGHGKSRTRDTAYRTISTCPVLAKALDLYVKDLHKTKWIACQAPTQYQSEGSSHELASLLVTELIQCSLYTLKEPAYLLFLDAKSAFDRVLPELLIRNLYKAGMDGNSTILVDNRLTSRHTYLDWDRSLMGPVKDQLGLEQGRPTSSDFYQIYSNENLISAQRSNQGIDLGNSQRISAVGLADDTMLEPILSQN